jgi:hypothetical protein
MGRHGYHGTVAGSPLPREIRSIARTVGTIDAALRSVTDPATQATLMERCRSLEWHVNALATPPQYRTPR